MARSHYFKNVSIVEDDPNIIMSTILNYATPIQNVLLMISVLGNGLLVGSSRSLPAPVSPYLKLCVSLAAADLLTSLHLSWKSILSFINISMGMKLFTPCMFAVNESLRLSSMLCSNLHLFVLGLNHFVGTLWPIRHKVFVTTKRMRYVLINLWLIPHLVVFTWFWWSSITEFKIGNCELRFYLAFPFRLTIFLLSFIPMASTVIMYAVIVRCLTKAQTRMVRSGHSSDDPLTRKCSLESTTQKKMKLVWTSLIIVSSYCFSWGPQTIFFVTVCQSGCPITAYTEISFRTAAILSQSIQTLVVLKMAANLFIYTLRMDKFRQCIGNDLRKLKSLFNTLRNLASKVLFKYRAPLRKNVVPEFSMSPIIHDTKEFSMSPIIHEFYLDHGEISK
ncbi:unnamed protein product, partial [Mesorhabditis belari]|uniref:G-protein coupled receptors family 1 profile domain-containing protein n=1 Tax=Mesorhabditis belari TaxID=2138241 RepID=A0AAF3EGM4_9BILA